MNPVINDFRFLYFIEDFEDCDHQFMELENPCFYGRCFKKGHPTQ